MKRQICRFVVLLAAAIAAVLATSLTAGAVPGPHAAAGRAQLSSKLWLTIEASDRQAGPKKATAWLQRDVPLAETLQIDLTCVSVSWESTPYPIFPWIPYHVLHASGTGSDGATYFVTIFDLGPAGAGHRDLASLTTSPGEAACGGTSEADPIGMGDFAIGA